MKISALFASACVALAGASGGASAATTSIGFEAASLGFVNQTFVEDGFTIAATGGSFFQAEDGTDGAVEYERQALTNGILTISRAASFIFDSLDWQTEYYGGSTSTIMVEGFLGAVSMGTDSFSTSSTAYTTFSASVLAGVAVDSLVFSAQRDGSAGGSLDAVVLSDVAPVPLPAAGWMLIAGLGGLAAMGRRKKA